MDWDSYSIFVGIYFIANIIAWALIVKTKTYQFKVKYKLLLSCGIVILLLQPFGVCVLYVFFLAMDKHDKNKM